MQDSLNNEDEEICCGEFSEDDSEELEDEGFTEEGEEGSEGLAGRESLLCEELSLALDRRIQTC